MRYPGSAWYRGGGRLRDHSAIGTAGMEEGGDGQMEKRQQGGETIPAREAAEIWGVSGATVTSGARAGGSGGYQ